MPKITIDEQELEIENNYTVFQACQIAGKEIPHFCFHQKLNIAGNCRMCLVEIEKSPKLVASCAMPISDGMVIHTNTQKVQKARQSVMELLLINHPLDCPICDQGGECDLQDQAFKYGKGNSRFIENKRSVIDKNMGPLIKTSMNRCIHCTRCVRFAREIAGIDEIGAINRGEHTEITTYLSKTITSELSANVIDLCPVGALTSKPYAFKARSWELIKTESIDVFDALGSNIRIDSKGIEVMRILPKVNDDINEEWISDKARFAFDGLKNMRIDRPYINQNGIFSAVSLDEALSHITDNVKFITGDKILAVAGKLVPVEPLFLLKELFQKQFNSNNFFITARDYKFNTESRGNYLFNTTIAGIDKTDLCLLIGANPKEIAPVLNARIGRMQRSSNLHVARIGEVDNQTYKIEELGNNIKILENILSGKHKFSNTLENSKFPMIIIGDAIYTRKDSSDIISMVYNICEKYNIIRPDWNGFNILHNYASVVGALDIGFYCNKNLNDVLDNSNAEVVYLFGDDEVDINKLKNRFIIYHGHHGNDIANIANVIIPASGYTEQDGWYVNLEGRVQEARMAVPAPFNILSDWYTIYLLAKKLKIDICDPMLEEIRNMIAEKYPIFQNTDIVIENKCSKLIGNNKNILYNDLVNKIPINYYMTDSISSASVTMAKCIQNIRSHDV